MDPMTTHDSVVFTNDTREAQPWHAKMTCLNCQKIGHIAAFFENDKVSNMNVQDEGVHKEVLLELIDAVQQDADKEYYAALFLCEDQEHMSVSFQIKDGISGGRIPKEWILLDIQSTTDSFSNPDFCTDIHEVRDSLIIHTQAGKAVTKLRGTVPGYGEVWYCSDGIANILSLAHIANNRSVKLDSTNGNQFEVTKDDRSTRIFKQSQCGFYYYDMNPSKSSTRQGHRISLGNGSTILLNTVTENKTKYTVSDYQCAEKDRTIQLQIGRPRTKRYLELANKWWIINCDVNRQDILNAEHVFGPDPGSLKGNTTRKASDQVHTVGLVPIPATIMTHYRKVVICVDVMKVNKVPFIVTISREINFGTVAWLKNEKAETILENITEVCNL
jgi:hypothetical protein